MGEPIMVILGFAVYWAFWLWVMVWITNKEEK